MNECEYCGKEYEPIRYWQRFCSQECQMANYWEIKRADKKGEEKSGKKRR